MLLHRSYEINAKIEYYNWLCMLRKHMLLLILMQQFCIQSGYKSTFIENTYKTIMKLYYYTHFDAEMPSR